MDLSRIEKIKSMGFDPHTVYYHGTSHDFDNFDTRGTGLFGHGIYTTTLPFTASKYAGFRAEHTSMLNAMKAADGDVMKALKIKEPAYGHRIIPVHVRGNKPIFVKTQGSKLKDTTFTSDELNSLLENHPNKESEHFKSFISQYPSIKDAANSLSKMPAYQVLDKFSKSKLYGDDQYDDMLHSEVTKHTGYDHIIADRTEDGIQEKWAVLWHPHQVRGIHAKFEKDHTNDLMEDFRTDAVKYVVGKLIGHYIQKKKEQAKQAILNKISGNGVTEDAPAANVTANVATYPVVDVIQQNKIRMRNRLKDNVMNTKNMSS